MRTAVCGINIFKKEKTLVSNNRLVCKFFFVIRNRIAYVQAGEEIIFFLLKKKHVLNMIVLLETYIEDHETFLLRLD